MFYPIYIYIYIYRFGIGLIHSRAFVITAARAEEADGRGTYDGKEGVRRVYSFVADCRQLYMSCRYRMRACTRVYTLTVVTAL